MGSILTHSVLIIYTSSKVLNLVHPHDTTRRRAQRLYFNCNERFTARHKCSKAQLLIFDSESNMEEALYDESSIEEQRTVPKANVDLQITYYALT